MDTTTKTSLSICRRLINHDSSKFLIAPLSGKRYIKNEEVDLLLSRDEILFSVKVKITNYTRPQFILTPSNNLEEAAKFNYWLR
jgi:hypothetical protein